MNSGADSSGEPKIFERYFNFLFREVDGRVYSLFRIAFSLAVFFNFMDLWSYRFSLFSDRGMLDQNFVSQLCEGQPYYSLFHHFVSVESVTAIFVISGISIAFMAAGFLTRWSILVVYVFQLSYISAIFPALSGWDTLLTVYTFLLLISPTGKMWSVDGWFRKRLLNKETAKTEPAYGLFLMQIQLCIIYISTAGLKLYDHFWLNGEFFSYFMLSVYSRFPDPAFAGYTLFSKMLTYGALVIEFSVPFLLFSKKLKWLGFFLGFSLHLGIMLASNLFIFSFTMLTLYIPFLKNLNEAVCTFYRKAK